MRNGQSIFQLSVLLIMLGVGVCRADPPVVDEDVLTGWDYQTVRRVSYPAFFCEETPLPQKALYQGVRSVKPHPDMEDSYWRFTLAMEVYASDQQAGRRLRAIHNPVSRNSKQRKLCDMRKGFQSGNRVYFVHTDVSAYVSQLPLLLEKLRHSVEGKRRLDMPLTEGQEK